jgi:hypothetical protein
MTNLKFVPYVIDARPADEGEATIPAGLLGAAQRSSVPPQRDVRNSARVESIQAA